MNGIKDEELLNIPAASVPVTVFGAAIAAVLAAVKFESVQICELDRAS